MRTLPGGYKEKVDRRVWDLCEAARVIWHITREFESDRFVAHTVGADFEVIIQRREKNGKRNT